MKKTIIALALAATTVSGSALAWTENGTGSSLTIGGDITVVANTNPWEVQVGADKMDFNAPVKSGDTAVKISVTSPLPVVGIRTKLNTAFPGVVGIAPQVTYTGVDVNAFNAGVTTLTLDAMDGAAGSTTKLGTLTAPFSAAALMSQKVGAAAATKMPVMAATAGDAFHGGVGTTAASAPADVTAATALLNSLSTDYVANFADQSGTDATAAASQFNGNTSTYSAAFGAGIPAGSELSIAFDKAVTADVKWKSVMPITVAYQ